MKVFLKDGRYFMEDNDNIVELFPDKNDYLKLPENSCDRIFVSCAKIRKSINNMIDYGTEKKAHRIMNNSNISNKSNNSSFEKILSYLNYNDKIVFQSLIEKAKKSMEIERLKKEIEENQRKLAEMESLS